MEDRNSLVVVAGGAAVGAAVGGVVGAAVGAAVGVATVHWIKQQEDQSQKLTDRAESRQSVINPPPPPVTTPRSQQITNQFLVLVIPATQAEFLESLRAKRRIDMSDGERLYEITEYLCLDSATDFNKSVEACIKQYSVSKGKKSEYDIYLVYFKLKQPDEGFKPNINQLDRYDAFRKLDYLEIDFKISPRLQMEAYGNFEVYNR